MVLDTIIDYFYSWTAIAVVIVIALYYFSAINKGLPPGPTGVPILGYWPFLNSKTIHLQLDALKKKYGDIFCFTVTGTLYINLGTAKVIREVHIARADCFGSRIEEFSLFSHAFKDGVGFVNGEAWKVLRKYFIQVLKDRGVASIKESVCSSLYDSVNSLVEELRAKNGDPQDLVGMLTDKCNANLRKTLFGDSGVTPEQVNEVIELYAAITDAMTPTNTLLTGNIARLIFAVMPSSRVSLRKLKPLEDAIYKIIDEHKSSYNEEHMRDIIDEYLKERNLRKSKGDPTGQYFTDKALMATLLQFLGDGVLGVAVFVAYFLQGVITHPEEQEKMFEELKEVVGEGREPTIEDKSRLTYTNAFILEVSRMGEFFPVFPSQQCVKETTLRGYRIPVGAVTLMNSWSANFDPCVYEEPEKFNPSRFINRDIGVREELPVTFGIGRRACLGEGFTMMQVFLFVTSLVKNFKLTLANSGDVKLDIFRGKVEVCATPRNQK